MAGWAFFFLSEAKGQGRYFIINYTIYDSITFKCKHTYIKLYKIFEEIVNKVNSAFNN